MNLAYRIALNDRHVSHINFPVGLEECESDEHSKRNIPHHTSEVLARSARVPSEADLRRGAEILNEGKKVVILVGQGALHATDELIETADKLGAPIVKALLGKAAVARDCPESIKDRPNSSVRQGA
jgi:pyruvate dehydrogenase (quinone)